MILYIQNYGLTQLRVYTTWFMILTALIFIYVIIRQFKSDFSFIRASAVTFTLMFALLCFSRPDALIARYNMEYCADQLTFHDIIEMTNLSSDAAVVITDEKYEELVNSKYTDYKYAYEDITGREYISKLICRNINRTLYDYFNIPALKLDSQISE